MEGARIWVLCIAAAVLYGELHDQITARVCVEYFTIGHPPVFATDSPTLLALGWGFIATWWVGAILGLMVVACARIGPRPKLSARELLLPLCCLMVGAGLCALIAGIAGYVSARNGGVSLDGYLGALTPAAKHAAFIADWWAHTTSYAAAFAGSLALSGWIVWRRAWQTRSGSAAVELAPVKTGHVS
ncbi:MAG: hypothetical protein JOY86_01515 [Candidatus Eremiobacteraeota bacterium]|nr:hypothetical protein [Candidatus Eremiobacteraeota bacterium]